MLAVALPHKQFAFRQQCVLIAESSTRAHQAILRINSTRQSAHLISLGQRAFKLGCSDNTSVILLTKCKPVMILPQVHLRKPCYDFYFL